VTLSAAASSSIGVSAIQYELDGYALGVPFSSGLPFNFQWDTKTMHFEEPSWTGTNAIP
jgi:hypothetical protein